VAAQEHGTQHLWAIQWWVRCCCSPLLLLTCSSTSCCWYCCLPSLTLRHTMLDTIPLCSTIMIAAKALFLDAISHVHTASSCRRGCVCSHPVASIAQQQRCISTLAAAVRKPFYKPSHTSTSLACPAYACRCAATWVTTSSAGTCGTRAAALPSQGWQEWSLQQAASVGHHNQRQQT
jgi:hypothetical protein